MSPLAHLLEEEWARIWNGKWGEESTYDGVKEKVGIMGIADANTTRSGLLRRHGCGEVEGSGKGAMVGFGALVVVVVVVVSKGERVGVGMGRGQKGVMR